MLGIVVVTQGDLAREFIAALEHVVGQQQCVSAVCIAADDDMESGAPRSWRAPRPATPATA